LTDKKRALVVGGTRGIGRGIAEGLVAAGWEVVAAGRNPHSTLQKAGLATTKIDVSDQRSVDEAVAQLDRLDALVNSAGIIARGGAEFEIETFQRVIEVNLTGTMRLCVACKPLLAASGGSIVNIASMLSFFGGPLVPAYTASKGGVAQLTKALAAAWGAEGIRVNAVAPGWIATEMTQALQADEARSAAIRARTPQGRWGTPEDLAGAVAFLCSDAAAFVNGVILPVDGGYLTV
jgi:NAD(P)-dependent dehydrogenase (short-subunit alcohol dehydrogenase family)